MISANTNGRSKEEIKSIHLDEPVDPFNYMLTAYPPVSIIIYNVVIESFYLYFDFNILMVISSIKLNIRI